MLRLARINQFSPVTKSRIYNTLAITFIYAVMTPLLVELKGELFDMWLISLLGIATTLVVKTNSWVVAHTTIPSIYRFGIWTQVAMTLILLMYYIDKELFLWADLTVSTFEVGLFSAYRIHLDEFMAKTTPEEIKQFQIVRNSLLADVGILGAVVAMVSSYVDPGYTVGVLILSNIIYIIWMLKHYNQFDKAVI